LDPEDVKQTLLEEANIVGIIPVHLYGVPADMDALRSLASLHEVWLLEDAAEAHGATYCGKRTGSLGKAATFSFFGNKLLTMGEGGVVTTSCSDIAKRCVALRSQGVSSGYWHSIVGYNYRLGNLQAALGLGQLETYDQHAALRHVVCERYSRALAGRPFQFQFCTPNAVSAQWMFSVLLPKNVNRDEVINTLSSQYDIETRPVFPPIPMQSPYFDAYVPPVSADIASRGINLPTHGKLTANDVTSIALALERVCCA
jgi:perosamine synthetase